MDKVLVTGANGFLGSHLVDSLVENGYAVRAFGRFNEGVEQKFTRHPQVEVVVGDFLNHNDLRTALKGVDYVFHLISMTNPATAEDDPVIDIETNVKGSVEFLQLCAEERSLKRLIFTSSGGTVYGESQSGGPIHESDPTLPISPYGIGKLSIENYLRYFKKKKGLDYTVFRVANLFGDRQPFWKRQGVIPIFLHQAIKGESITIMGDGTMVRDYVYVRDVADMMVNTLRFAPEYEVYNLGSGKGVSVSDIVVAVEKTINHAVAIEHREVPATFVHTSILDTSRYYQEFGVPKYMSLEEGIRRTYDYLNKEGESENSR